MIEYRKGDIFSADVEAIVNTVNCVGVMGRGIALQFKQKFPDNFRYYEKICKRKEMSIGKMLVYDQGLIQKPRYIINFPTKRHWRNSSYLEDIELGLMDLTNEIITRKIATIAIPPLGCGLGGLNWQDVRKRMEGSFASLDDVCFYIYEPANSMTAVSIMTSTQKPRMTAGRAALLGLMRCYIEGYLTPIITLLEIHKLMYFLQCSGEPLNLKFVKAPFGPYAENLRHVLKQLEGHMIRGYIDGGDAPGKEIELVPEAEREASDFLRQQPMTSDRIAKVRMLIDGFESSFGLELLATVHWLIVAEGITTYQDVIKNFYLWSEHKNKFTPRQITIAVNRLLEKQWIVNFEGMQTSPDGGKY